MHINDILKEMVANSASDLHLKPGAPPTFRIHGVYADSKSPALTADQVRELIGQMTTDEQKMKFDDERELDFAYGIPDVARFRVNVYLQAGELACVIRIIPIHIETIEELGLPLILKKLADKPRGLILVTGPTGSGKSTTLAAMIDYINKTRRCHIITIEDPVEFVHQDKMSRIDQREVGRDTLSFNNALKRVLRQDPNVILIGEMRDLETVATAITAAETGHLVFATLHTPGAAQTIDRIIDVFPAEQQPQIKSQLSLVLEAIISQVLVPAVDGKSRIAALEILIANGAIRNLIRAHDLAMVESTMFTSRDEGMQTIDTVLKEMADQGKITKEMALAKARNRDFLNKLFEAQNQNKKK